MRKKKPGEQTSESEGDAKRRSTDDEAPHDVSWMTEAIKDFSRISIVKAAREISDMFGYERSADVDSVKCLIRIADKHRF